MKFLILASLALSFASAAEITDHVGFRYLKGRWETCVNEHQSDTESYRTGIVFHHAYLLGYQQFFSGPNCTGSRGSSYIDSAPISVSKSPDAVHTLTIVNFMSLNFDVTSATFLYRGKEYSRCKDRSIYSSCQ
jgi:hypothetical protein